MADLLQTKTPGFDAGFTIVELMMTLMLVAIVLAFGVPNMTQLMRGNQIANQANTILGGIQLARSEAARRGVGTAVCGSDDGENCTDDWGVGWIVYLDPNGSASGPANDDDILRVETGGNDLQTVSGGIVRYDSQGIRRPSADSSAAIAIRFSSCGPEKGRVVNITRGGRASIGDQSC